ncbi:hypothetical protein JCM1840_006761 [Sporobolomyces johnsonii]
MFPASPSASESEEEGCYVYWETKPILPVPSPTTRERTSQRSGAPSPSLAVASNGTPKPKRTTAVASLPSPSAPASLQGRAPRVRKKRKAIERRNTAQELPSQPMDARTLQMVSQLAMKVNARSQPGYSSPALLEKRSQNVRAATMAVTDSKGKGKMVEGNLRPPIEPLRPPPNCASSSRTTTPLRRSVAHTPQTLRLSSTKPSLTKPFPFAASSAVKPAPAVPTSTRARTGLSEPSVLTSAEDDDEDYFDDVNDTSFELALSQFDETASVITAATSPAVAASTVKRLPRAPEPKPKGAASPAPSVTRHLAKRGAGPAAPPARAVPVPRQPPTVAAPASAPHRTSTRPLVATSPACNLPSAAPLAPASSKHHTDTLILRTGATTRHMSAEKQREMEELAKREIAELEGLEGAGDWSDDSF